MSVFQGAQPEGVGGSIHHNCIWAHYVDRGLLGCWLLHAVTEQWSWHWMLHELSSTHVSSSACFAVQLAAVMLSVTVGLAPFACAGVPAARQHGSCRPGCSHTTTQVRPPQTNPSLGLLKAAPYTQLAQQRLSITQSGQEYIHKHQPRDRWSSWAIVLGT